MTQTDSAGTASRGEPDSRPTSSLARAVAAALAACAVVAGWGAAVEWGREHYAARARAGLAPYLDVGGLRWDHRATTANNLLFVLILLTAALFITWHYRLLRRLERSLSQPLPHSPGWAIGGWFVPLLNLVRPKQMVNDTWRATTPPEATTRRIPLSFHFWWALWLLSSLLTGIAGHLPGGSLDEIVARGKVAVAGDVATVGAALLAMVVVLTLDQRSALVPEPIPVAEMPGMMLFNAPPGWPAQPLGWQPPPGWQPDPSWPPAPAGWTFWVSRHERWLARLDAPEDQNRGGSK